MYEPFAPSCTRIIICMAVVWMQAGIVRLVCSQSSVQSLLNPATYVYQAPPPTHPPNSCWPSCSVTILRRARCKVSWSILATAVSTSWQLSSTSWPATLPLPAWSCSGIGKKHVIELLYSRVPLTSYYVNTSTNIECALNNECMG